MLSATILLYEVLAPHSGLTCWAACRRLNSQLQAERAERTARNTQLRDMSIRQSTLLDIGRALERRTNTALARLQQEVSLRGA